MRSIIVLPGRPPQWLTDHARDLAQRLSDNGAVVVAFMRQPTDGLVLPGQSPPASVLGHSTAGQPLWTGRVLAGMGLLPRRRTAVVVQWDGAGAVSTLLAAVAARLRGDYTVLELADTRARTGGVVRRATRRLAHDVVEVANGATGSEEGHRLLALCGADVELARLVLDSLDSMGEEAARSWRCEVRVDPDVRRRIALGRLRHAELIEVTVANGESLGPATADVVVASATGPEATVVRESVATGGAGVLIGSPRSQVVRCHDGVWLSRRDPAALLVAIEASFGHPSRPSVMCLRNAASRIERLVWDVERQQRERWAGRPRRHSEQVVS